MPEKTTHSPSIKDIQDSAWKKLSEKRIYFGHQSVGLNIIDGINDLMKENPRIRLNIVKTSDPSDFNSSLFAHSSVGKNMDPQSKIDAFARLMRKGIGDRTDIAFFKLCFVDITLRSDLEEIFTSYKDCMSRLIVEYPKTTFIYFTVPLTSRPTGTKLWIKGTKNLIKKIIGKSVVSADDNIKRNKFNEMLKKEYDGKGRIFDLSKIESTFPDGTRSIFTKDGRTYYSLIPEYTNDGGHLNEKGRKIVAEQLLILLVNLCG